MKDSSVPHQGAGQLDGPGTSPVGGEVAAARNGASQFVNARIVSYNTGMALHFENDDARYHVWLDPETLRPPSRGGRVELHRNLRDPALSHGKSHRLLRGESKTWAPILAEMLGRFDPAAELARAQMLAAQSLEAARQARENAIRADRIRDAAPDLFAACVQAENLIRDGGVVPVKGVTWEMLRAALAKARGES